MTSDPSAMLGSGGVPEPGRPNRRLWIGLGLALVGLLVMLWAPGAWPIIGVVLTVGGLAVVLRDATQDGPAWASVLWRRTTGGPPPGGDPD